MLNVLYLPSRRYLTEALDVRADLGTDANREGRGHVGPSGVQIGRRRREANSWSWSALLEPALGLLAAWAIRLHTIERARY